MGRHQFTMPKTTMPGVAAVIADSDRSFPRHMHDQFGIGVIERGAQKSASGRGIVEAGAGRVITVNPGEVHDGIALGESGRAWTMLYLDTEIVHAALSDIRERDSRDFEFVYPVDPRPLADRFRALFQAITSQRAALPGEEALLLLLSQTLERPPRCASSGRIHRWSVSRQADDGRGTTDAPRSRRTLGRSGNEPLPLSACFLLGYGADAAQLSDAAPPASGAASIGKRHSRRRSGLRVWLLRSKPLKPCVCKALRHDTRPLQPRALLIETCNFVQDRSVQSQQSDAFFQGRPS